MNPPPKDYEPIFRTSPYLEMIGPIYNKHIEKDSGKGIIIGFYAQEKHCNAKGSVHGGIVGGIADISLGYNSSLSQIPPINMVTTSLSIDYMGSIVKGDWVEVHTTVQKVGSRVAFASCFFVVNDTRVVRASGVFSVINSSA